MNMPGGSTFFGLRSALAKLIIVILIYTTLTLSLAWAMRTLEDNSNSFWLEQLPRGPVAPSGRSGCSHFSAPGGGGNCPINAAFMESSAYPKHRGVPLGIAGRRAGLPPIRDNAYKNQDV